MFYSDALAKLVMDSPLISLISEEKNLANKLEKQRVSGLPKSESNDNKAGRVV